MLKLLFLPIFFISLLTGCATQSAPITAEAEITAFGIYTPLEKARKVVNYESTAGKSRIMGDIKYLEETTTVPAVLKNRFGFTYNATKLPTKRRVEIRQVFKHPKFRGKTGFKKTIYYTTDFYGSFVGKIGYGFDEEFELVTGDWAFEIWYKNKLLTSKTFTVVEG